MKTYRDDKKYKKILIISDLHVPFHHMDSFEFLATIKKKYQPDKVISIGDIIDWHSISFHDKDPDLLSPGDELKEAIKELKPLYKLFPSMLIADSNHDSLVFRKALAGGLSKRFFKPYNDIIEAPSTWNWHFDFILKTPLGDVYFHHSKGADILKVSQAMGMSCVQGHWHERFEVRYWGNPNALLYGMTVGCLVNSRHMAMAYGKNNLRRPVIGCGMIINGRPKLIPMVLDKNGAWDGNVD